MNTHVESHIQPAPSLGGSQLSPRVVSRWSISLVLLAFAALGFGQATQQPSQTAPQMVDPNRVVLVINGEEIKGAEYYRRMEYLQGVGIRTGNDFTEFPPGFLTIQHIIDERLAFGLAKEKGIYPTDTEVDEEIKIREEENPKLLENWIASGGNIDELKYLFRYQLTQFKLQTFGITKTDTEVEQFYKDHPEMYTIPKQLKLRVIAVATSDDTKAVDQELASGKDFAAVAREKSVDITKAIGGEYGTIPEYKLATTVRDALANVKIGDSTTWLSSSSEGAQGTFLKFLKEDIIPPKKLDFDNSLKRVIRRKLMLEAGTVKNANLTKELDAYRLKMKIDIRQPEFADAYQKFIAAYFKQRGISQ